MQSPEKSGIIAYFYLAFFLVIIAFVVALVMRHPAGSTQESTGTIESIGYTDVGGGGLHGRISRHAVVRLPSGNIAQVLVPTNQRLVPGTQVVLTEIPQNFGQPEYGFIRLSSSGQP